jgi:hypothetical protein
VHIRNKNVRPQSAPRTTTRKTGMGNGQVANYVSVCRYTGKTASAWSVDNVGEPAVRARGLPSACAIPTVDAFLANLT